MQVEPSTPAVSSRALFKNMLKGSALYMIAMASPSVLSLILVPIVTRVLAQSDYGVLDLLQQVSSVVSILLGMNFASAMGYFYFETGAQRSSVVGTVLSGALLIGTFACVVGCIFAQPISVLVFNSPHYVPYLRLIFCAMPLNFLLEAGFSWLRTEDRSGLFTGAVILRLVLILTGTLVLLLGFGFRVGAVLGANLIAISVVAMAIAVAAVRFHGLLFNRALFARVFRFTLPLSFSALALFLIHFGDRFVLARYRALADVGIYAVAYKLGMLLGPVQAAFEAYWASQIYQIIKRGDARMVFARTFTYLVLVISFAGLGILVATKPALRIFTPPSYFAAAALVPIILLAYFLRAVGDYFRILFLAHGLSTHDAACNWIAAICAIAGYLILIPRYGMFGAAIATLITFIGAATLSILWTFRVWHFHVEWGRLCKLIAVLAGLVAIHFALGPASNTVEIVRGILIIAAYAPLLWFLQFASPGERQLIRAAAGRFAPWILTRSSEV